MENTTRAISRRQVAMGVTWSVPAVAAAAAAPAFAVSMSGVVAGATLYANPLMTKYVEEQNGTTALYLNATPGVVIPDATACNSVQNKKITIVYTAPAGIIDFTKVLNAQTTGTTYNTYGNGSVGDSKTKTFHTLKVGDRFSTGGNSAYWEVTKLASDGSSISLTYSAPIDGCYYYAQPSFNPYFWAKDVTSMVNQVHLTAYIGTQRVAFDVGAATNVQWSDDRLEIFGPKTTN
ncbi:hypothetical protein [uncultured Micrococcus sp.]|uniref:hypothetical protein n=1 Tax=uncultured Micrococcus sp. TaxID=114051 RepID=UPI002620DEFF|nr:hypothetical protein [uncultured Micrococcus sp.]